jgi:glycosyltransferase involved in cell wall biosynthesis
MIVGVSGYIGKAKTGIGRTLENILLSMSQLDPDSSFYLFVNFDQDAFSKRPWPSNIKIITYGVSKNNPIANIFWHQYGYQLFLKRFGCGYSLIPNFSLLLWKNLPTVVVIHDLIEFNVPSKFNRVRIAYRHIAVPRMARHADRVITVSEHSKNDIVNRCRIDPAKVVVAYNGCDRSLFKRYDEETVSLRLGQLQLIPNSYILYVGTIDYPGKNVHSLIKAFFRLKERYNIDEKLIIVGGRGHRASVVFDMVNGSRFSKDVRFFGFAQDEDLPCLYSGAKLFCFLSYYEGFGLPLLEAMSCGCPVMAADTSSLPEVVGDAGLIVNPNDIDQISNAIYRVIKSPELQWTMRANGLNRANEFSWHRAANQYLNVFQSMNIRSQ